MILGTMFSRAAFRLVSHSLICVTHACGTAAPNVPPDARPNVLEAASDAAPDAALL